MSALMFDELPRRAIFRHLRALFTTPTPPMTAAAAASIYYF